MTGWEGTGILIDWLIKNGYEVKILATLKGKCKCVITDLFSAGRTIATTAGADIPAMLLNAYREATESSKRRCEICWKSKRVQRHHKFSQTEWARKLYGDLLDHPFNIQMVCGDCHASHRSEKLIIWSEEAFCAALNIEPRSKLARTRSRANAD